MKNPLISIITVTYNSEKYLEQTILSVVQQSYSNYEFFIIDGGSTDTTLDIIKKYDDVITFWISEPDNGMYDALNKGINLSKGEIVGQINSDDLYEKNVLKNVAEEYNKEPFDMLYGDTTLINSKGKKIGYIFAAKWKNMYYANPEFLHSACFFSRSILQALNGYSTVYKIASDIDLFQRIFLRTRKIRIQNLPYSRQRKGGMSHRGLGPYIGYWEYCIISINNGCKPLLALYYFFKKSILRLLFLVRDYFVFFRKY